MFPAANASQAQQLEASTQIKKTRSNSKSPSSVNIGQPTAQPSALVQDRDGQVGQDQSMMTEMIQEDLSLSSSSEEEETATASTSAEAQQKAASASEAPSGGGGGSSPEKAASAASVRTRSSSRSLSR